MAKKVLMIEDDLVEIEMVKDLLIKEGYEFASAEDGEKGIEKAKQQIPHLIILDIMLPGKDGFYVCDILKKDAKTKDIPIILLSSLDDPDLESKGADAKAVYVIRKPYDEEILKSKIKEFLN